MVEVIFFIVAVLGTAYSFSEIWDGLSKGYVTRLGQPSTKAYRRGDPFLS